MFAIRPLPKKKTVFGDFMELAELEPATPGCDLGAVLVNIQPD
jgi:hypothetical protein